MESDVRASVRAEAVTGQVAQVNAGTSASEAGEPRASLRPGSRFGPGLLVAAAFIGPGTVVTASRAGAQYGCELLWTIVLAALGAIILQSFAARLGILNRQGLGEALRASLSGTLLRVVVCLVVLAIGAGNAAYQTGNLTGAAAGLSSIWGGNPAAWLIGLASLTSMLLWVGEVRWLQRILVGLVCLLSLAFLTTAALCLPTLDRLLYGLLVPSVSTDSLVLVLALIGTTIVPYNLFLHASAAAQNWRDVDAAVALRQAHWDTGLSIGLGGLVTASVVLTASAAYHDSSVELVGIEAMAEQLKPTLGQQSSVLFGLGLFSAGLTSALTAPLATAFALCGIMGWSTSAQGNIRFRAIALCVVISGTLFAVVYRQAPSGTILLAQVANGVLLPVIAGLLVWISTRTRVREGVQPLSRFQLLTGCLVVVGVTGLAAWKLSQLL